MTVRVVIADDHPIFRDGLGSLITSKPDLDLVGKADRGEEVWSLVREAAPDVAVCDVSMPDFGAGGLLTRVQAESLPTRVIALTIHDEPAICRPLLRAGVHGYVTKTSAFDDLEEAIRQAMRDHRFISSAILQHLLDEPTDAPALSRRETEVLQLIGEGLVYKQIADRLGISVRTVETYRERLLEKLNLRTTADLIRYSAERNKSL